jgi:nitrogen fixation NifU-like protein
MSLESLYQETILDHFRNPRHHGAIEGSKTAVHQENPSCGDQIDLQVLLDADGNIQDIRFTGHGCAISQASASMMTEVVFGKSEAETRALIEHFRAMIVKGEPPGDELGDLEALQGVRKFPTRVKCAMLAWGALEKILNGPR